MRATTVSMDGSPDSSQAYRSWRARARALVSGRRTEPLERVGRLERGRSGFGALAQPGQGLTLRVGREHAEPDRDAMRQRDVPQPTRRFARDVLEMRRLAANDAAERDDHVEALADCGGFGRHGQLEGAWNVHDVD